MGITYPTFRKKYLQKYPMKDGYLIRHEHGACIFLKFEDGLAGCVIHQFKPEACRNWKAGLEKPECREGLRQKAETARLIPPPVLRLTGDDLTAFCAALTPDQTP